MPSYVKIGILKLAIFLHQLIELLLYKDCKGMHKKGNIDTFPTHSLRSYNKKTYVIDAEKSPVLNC